MQSWGAKIKAAISGEVDGGDIQSLIAATSPLSGLRQTLADRRLEAELAHLGQEWQVAVDLAGASGPLWLADALVTLAGSLIDAEADAHQNHSTLLSALSAHHARALLEPVGPLLIEISGILADPGYRPAFALPLLFGQQASAVDGSISYIPGPYLHGLLLGVDRLEGAAGQSLDALDTLTARSPAPAWLKDGVQRLRGDLAALGTRLEILRAQASALLARPSGDSGALHQLAAGLWSSLDVLLRIGQVAGSPTLLPGAIAPTRFSQAPRGQFRQGPPVSAPFIQPRPFQPVAVPSPQSPAPPPPPSPHFDSPPMMPVRPMPQWEERPRPLPEIAPEWQTPAVTHRQGTIESPAEAPHPHPLPEIGGAGSGTKKPSDLRPHPLPEIGTVNTPITTPAVGPRPLPQIGGRSSSSISAGAGASSVSTDGGRAIERKDRWFLSSQVMRHRLRAAGREDQAEQELNAFWDARAWRLSPAAAAYTDQLAALLASGIVQPSGRSMGTAPFAVIYRVAASEITVLGSRLSAGALFCFDYQHDRLARPGSGDGEAE